MVEEMPHLLECKELDNGQRKRRYAKILLRRLQALQLPLFLSISAESGQNRSIAGSDAHALLFHRYSATI
jgi:hypothetical protein